MNRSLLPSPSFAWVAIGLFPVVTVQDAACEIERLTPSGDVLDGDAVASVVATVPLQFESDRTGVNVSVRGRQPTTLAWAHEEGMDIRSSLTDLMEELDRAESNDGVIDQREMQRIREKVARLHRETEEASIALEIAINDSRGSDNVARGGVKSAQVLSAEADLMAMADSIGLVVPNAHLRNRTRIRSLRPTPLAINAPDAA